MLAKRYGAKDSTLPILLDGAEVIQGSDVIIDWAEERAKHPGRSLNPPDALAEAREIERRAGEVIGVHTRRLAFANLLPDYPHVLKPALFHYAFGWRRLAGEMMWPGTWRIMMRLHDLKPGAAAESRAKVEAELDWLDGKLADGRSYLAGDRFSRADIAVASLLSNFARPKEKDLAHMIEGPEAFAEDVRRWSERPVMRWVLTQYSAHRTPLSAVAEQ
jgi:glutathione S-transferase